MHQQFIDPNALFICDFCLTQCWSQLKWFTYRDVDYIGTDDKMVVMMTLMLMMIALMTKWLSIDVVDDNADDKIIN